MLRTIVGFVIAHQTLFLVSESFSLLLLLLLLLLLEFLLSNAGSDHEKEHHSNYDE